jgi:hydrogenase expression/formation protein HypC
MGDEAATMSECVVAHPCITCGDVAFPMRVLAQDDERLLARCASAAGHREDVEIALVAPVAPGEWLLVHAGTAIGRAQNHDGDTADVGARAEGGDGRTTPTGGPA